MKRFIKVTIPSDTYKEVSQMGDVYVVHVGAEYKDDTVECYECTTDSYPDMQTLVEDLLEYKEYISGVELKVAKILKIKDLTAYDSSNSVNSFTINNKEMWLDANLRQQLRISLDACNNAGRETVTKWFDGVEYTFPIATWYQMLTALEVYASDALNVTEAHKAAINALTSKANVEAYDYTTDYPNKLVF